MKSSGSKSVSYFRNPRQGKSRWMFWLHWGFGMVFGLYFAVVCITGTLVVYKKELERASIPELVRVPAGETYSSFAAMTETVREAYPNHRLSNAYFYWEPGVTWSFRLQDDDGRTQVYVNPYTGAIVGADSYQGAFLQWVYDLHAYLLMGRTGMVVNAIGGFALFGMCFTGLIVWWPRNNRWRQAFSWNLKASWKRQTYDFHKLAGVFMLAPLALLAITGAYWGFPGQYEWVLGKITNGPGRVDAPRVEPIRTNQIPASIDDVLATAQRAMPQGTPTLFVYSSAPDKPHTVRMLREGDWRTVGDSSLYLHPQSGELLEVVKHEDLPLGARLQRDIYSLHFGTFWGHPTRILWMLVGLLGTGLVVSSYLMYWNRVLVKRWRRAPQAGVAHAEAEEAKDAAGGKFFVPVPVSVSARRRALKDNTRG